MKHRRILVFGASGTGATTIARQASHCLGYRHLDCDNYFWLPTEEPFTAERPREDCLAMLQADLQAHESWILSGSVTGWGEVLTPLFDLVVFVHVPTALRLERVREREHSRYGKDALEGGKYHQKVNDFIDWCAAYDAGTRAGRSLPKHEVWLKDVRCPVLRITNFDLDESIEAVVAGIKNGAD